MGINLFNKRATPVDAGKPTTNRSGLIPAETPALIVPGNRIQVDAGFEKEPGFKRQTQTTDKAGPGQGIPTQSYSVLRILLDNTVVAQNFPISGNVFWAAWSTNMFSKTVAPDVIRVAYGNGEDFHVVAPYFEAGINFDFIRVWIDTAVSGGVFEIKYYKETKPETVRIF